MSARKKYRVAVVGGAGIWGRYYLRAYAEHPDCEIVALVDRARERCRAFADRYGIETVYDSVEDLFAVEIPDIVSVSVPVGHNPDVVAACARAGVKAVSCEKPIAAQLSQADEMVRLCKESGTAFGCGTAYWEIPHLLATADWIKAGNIGRLTAAAIPGGLPNEVSGAGCVQLTMLRLLTGAEVEWVEGWILPRDENWMAPDGAGDEEIDSPAYGRLGLSGGILCEILEPQPDKPISCRIAVSGEEGQVWAGQPRPVLVKGKGALSTPVYPEFFDEPEPDFFITPAIERLMHAFDSGKDALCSGHDYRQALEIAIALKRSAAQDHRRVFLPLEDRSLRLFPHLYRLQGGDVAGWESVGYPGPPSVPPSITSFDELIHFSDREIQQLMRQVDQKVLVKALVDGGEEVKAKILSNLSERVQTFIREEIEFLGQVSRDEVEEARGRIVEIAQKL